MVDLMERENQIQEERRAQLAQVEKEREQKLKDAQKDIKKQVRKSK